MKRIIRSLARPVQARILIPGSKSMTNRALLLAALAEGVSEISSLLISDDTRAFINALHNLGIMIQLDETSRSCIVGGGFGKFPKKTANIWCEDAGTVARFLLAACGGLTGNYHFDGSAQLRRRPLEQLMQTLVRQGAVLDPPKAQQMPFTIIGADGLKGGEIDIDGSQSGQFISALLMIAPFAQSPVLIKTTELVSRPFVEMTCSMMAEFGVLVKRLHQLRFAIPVPQRYIARDYVIEPDLSSASYFFAAAAVTAGQVTIQPIETEDSKQGDVRFLAILEKMGCRLNENAQGLTVIGPAQLKGVSVDMRDCSDVFMTLAAIAPFANSPTTITNIGHTRRQECDRITVMRKGLEALGVKAEEGPDWIRIYPSTPIYGTIDSHNDHRIAMAFALIGLRVGIQIQNANCVTKTCPEFFTLWEDLYE
jgi:3-phosphoshikimate 1-carboxyvinyltransferase